MVPVIDRTVMFPIADDGQVLGRLIGVDVFAEPVLRTSTRLSKTLSSDALRDFLTGRWMRWCWCRRWRKPSGQAWVGN